MMKNRYIIWFSKLEEKKREGRRKQKANEEEEKKLKIGKKEDKIKRGKCCET